MELLESLQQTAKALDLDVKDSYSAQEAKYILGEAEIWGYDTKQLRESLLEFFGPFNRQNHRISRMGDVNNKVDKIQAAGKQKIDKLLAQLKTATSKAQQLQIKAEIARIQQECGFKYNGPKAPAVKKPDSGLTTIASWHRKSDNGTSPDALKPGIDVTPAPENIDGGETPDAEIKPEAKPEIKNDDAQVKTAIELLKSKVQPGSRCPVCGTLINQ